MPGDPKKKLDVDTTTGTESTKSPSGSRGKRSTRREMDTYRQESYYGSLNVPDVSLPDKPFPIEERLESLTFEQLEQRPLHENILKLNSPQIVRDYLAHTKRRLLFLADDKPRMVEAVSQGGLELLGFERLPQRLYLWGVYDHFADRFLRDEQGTPQHFIFQQQVLWILAKCGGVLPAVSVRYKDGEKYLQTTARAYSLQNPDGILFGTLVEYIQEEITEVEYNRFKAGERLIEPTPDEAEHSLIQLLQTTGPARDAVKQLDDVDKLFLFKILDNWLSSAQQAEANTVQEEHKVLYASYSQLALDIARKELADINAESQAPGETQPAFLSPDEAHISATSIMSKVAPEERPALALQLVKAYPPQTADQAIEAVAPILDALPPNEQQSLVWGMSLRVVPPSHRIEWACKFIRSNGLQKKLADGIITLIYKFNEINMMLESKQKFAEMEVLTDQLIQALSVMAETEQADVVQGVMDKVMSVVPEHLQERVVNGFRSRYSDVMENAKLKTLRNRVEQYKTQSIDDLLALYEIWKETKDASEAEYQIVQAQLKMVLGIKIATTVGFVCDKPRPNVYYLKAQWNDENGEKRPHRICRVTADGKKYEK